MASSAWYLQRGKMPREKIHVVQRPPAAPGSGTDQHQHYFSAGSSDTRRDQRFPTKNHRKVHRPRVKFHGRDYEGKFDELTRRTVHNTNVRAMFEVHKGSGINK
jgi:hypothetical protein